MRNSAGGFLSTIAGAVLLSRTVSSGHYYQPPYDLLSPLLQGCELLGRTPQGLLNSTTTFAYLVVWAVTGALMGLFSRPGWNTCRTTLWMGFFAALFATVSRLLVDPAFWTSSGRNLELLLTFVTFSMITQIGLIGALPVSTLLSRLMLGHDAPLPTKIETVCTCGAVFRSIPILCSECGRTLRTGHEE
ncbi:MAG: hypothetical protein HXY34_08405 [Candidatus Thorarchaeota archaeon]|nr:hypothetical protein [Candidatus Thorarchaeota archaeon]